MFECPNESRTNKEESIEDDTSGSNGNKKSDTENSAERDPDMEVLLFDMSPKEKILKENTL